MGKAAVILVAATLILLGLRYGDTAKTQFETGREQSEYQEHVVAQEIATSAFNLLESRVRDDFGGYRPTGASVSYGAGSYSLRATGPINGPLQLEAAGVVGQALHEVTATMLKVGESRYAAMTLDGPVSEFDISGKSYFISGVDTDPPSGLVGTGGQLNGAALNAVLEETYDLAVSAFEPDLVVGADGSGSIGFGRPDDALDVEALLQTAYAMPSPPLTVIEGNVTWDTDDVVGSPESPAVVVVKGDLKMKGNFEGYGLLVIEGSFETTSGGNPKWEGLIVMRSQGGTFKTRGNPEFWGAIIVQSVTVVQETGGEDDGGLPGGHFDVDVYTDKPGKPDYHAHQYDDRYDVTGLNYLQLGCKDDGGLCWQEGVLDAATGDVDLEFRNSAPSDMTFILRTSGAEYSGAVMDGASYTVDPFDVQRLEVEVAALCALAGTSPSDVKNNASNRDGAFTVSASEAGGGALLWEVAMYHHVKGDTCTTNGDGEADLVEVPDLEVIIEFAGNPRFQLSSAALDMVANLFPQMDPGTSKIVLKDIRDKRLLYTP